MNMNSLHRHLSNICQKLLYSFPKSSCERTSFRSAQCLNSISKVEVNLFLVHLLLMSDNKRTINHIWDEDGKTLIILKGVSTITNLERITNGHLTGAINIVHPPNKNAIVIKVDSDAARYCFKTSERSTIEGDLILNSFYGLKNVASKRLVIFFGCVLGNPNKVTTINVVNYGGPRTPDGVAPDPKTNTLGVHNSIIRNNISFKNVYDVLNMSLIDNVLTNPSNGTYTINGSNIFVSNFNVKTTIPLNTNLMLINNTIKPGKTKQVHKADEISLMYEEELNEVHEQDSEPIQSLPMKVQYVEPTSIASKVQHIEPTSIASNVQRIEPTSIASNVQRIEPIPSLPMNIPEQIHLARPVPKVPEQIKQTSSLEPQQIHLPRPIPKVPEQIKPEKKPIQRSSSKVLDFNWGSIPELSPKVQQIKQTSSSEPQKIKPEKKPIQRSSSNEPTSSSKAQHIEPASSASKVPEQDEQTGSTSKVPEKISKIKNLFDMTSSSFKDQIREEIEASMQKEMHKKFQKLHNKIDLVASKPVQITPELLSEISDKIIDRLRDEIRQITIECVNEFLYGG